MLGIKLFQTHVHPPLWEEEMEDMERCMIKVFEVGEMLWFSVVIEKGTSEKCHQRPIKNTCLT